MESERIRTEALEQLRTADRAEVAAWLSWEPRPWHGLYFAAWTAAFVATNGLSEGLGSSTVYVILALLGGGFLWLQRRQVGTYPTGAQPTELAWPTIWSTGLFLVVVVAAWVFAFSLPWVAVAAVGALLTLGVMEAYRRAYARAADRVRARLGIMTEELR